MLPEGLQVWKLLRQLVDQVCLFELRVSTAYMTNI
jgi:hypothetical protein